MNRFTRSELACWASIGKERDRHMVGERVFRTAALILAVAMVGCATGSGGGGLTIPEGQGMLTLEAGGIDRLSYRIFDQATDQEVVNVMGRAGWASSPRAYERSAMGPALYHFLAPGLYRLEVDTDLDQDEPITVDDVEVVAGQQRYAQVPVGRFSVAAVRVAETGDGGSEERQEQIPFRIYDYGLDHILGTGMTSTRVKHFVAREGLYKIRMEPRTGAGGEEVVDLIQEVSVRFGQVYPIQFRFSGFGEPGR